MGRERTLALLLIVAILGSYLVLTWETKASTVTYYAEYVKAPLPSAPYALSPGDRFNVTVSAPPHASNWTLKMVDVEDVISYTLPINISSYSTESELWTIEAMIPANATPSTYNLLISYRSGGEKATLMSPRSVWVFDGDLNRLVILACGDIKTPNPKSASYWKELVKESNIIDPDMLVLLGDLVERPTMISGWILWEQAFMELKDPTYVVIGNHEYESPGVAAIYQKIVGPRMYNAAIGSFLFVALDSQMEGYISMSGLDWLEGVLRGNVNKVKIICFHHSIFSPAKKPTLKTLNLDSIDDVDVWIKRGYIHPSWAEHSAELKRLMKIIVDYDIRLILYEHIHQDMNVVVEDWKGQLHYFISPAALAYDIRGKPDYRGFKLVTIYSNGTVSENSLYYSGTGMFTYPNSIPIDSGVSVNGTETVPHILGYIDYNVFNDENAASIVIHNRLNISLENPRIVLTLKGVNNASKIKLDAWTEKGGVVEELSVNDYLVVEREGAIKIIVKGVNVSPHCKLWIVAYTDKDAHPPELSIPEVPEHISPGSWLSFTVKVTDRGWGPHSLSIDIKEPADFSPYKVVDLIDYTENTVTYRVWIRAPSKNSTLNIGIAAKDIAGITSEELTYTIRVGAPQKTTTLEVTELTEMTTTTSISPAVNETYRAGDTSSKIETFPSTTKPKIQPADSITRSPQERSKTTQHTVMQESEVNTSQPPVEANQPRPTRAEAEEAHVTTPVILIITGIVLVVLAVTVAIKYRDR